MSAGTTEVPALRWSIQDRSPARCSVPAKTEARYHRRKRIQQSSVTKPDGMVTAHTLHARAQTWGARAVESFGAAHGKRGRNFTRLLRLVLVWCLAASGIALAAEDAQ